MTQAAGLHESREVLKPETVDRHLDKELRVYLFSKKPILEVEEAATEPGK